MMMVSNVTQKGYLVRLSDKALKGDQFMEVVREWSNSGSIIDIQHRQDQSKNQIFSVKQQEMLSTLQKGCDLNRHSECEFNTQQHLSSVMFGFDRFLFLTFHHQVLLYQFQLNTFSYLHNIHSPLHHKVINLYSTSYKYSVLLVNTHSIIIYTHSSSTFLPSLTFHLPNILQSQFRINQ